MDGRLAFESWAISHGYNVRELTSRDWKIWQAAVASVQPVGVLGYAIFRHGQQQAVEMSKTMADRWVDAQCIPLVAAQSAVSTSKGAAGAPVAAGSVDTCAEMRALCGACGGTGDVHSIDGEWRGQCTCVHGWQQRAEKAEAERDALKESVRLVTEDSNLWMTRAHQAEDARDTVLEQVANRAASACDCHACQPITLENNRMILCPTCGGKRCPPCQ